MPYSAGTAYLEITPSFLGIDKLIGDEVRKIAKRFDDELSKALPKATEQATGAAADAAARRIRAAFDALPDLKIDADSSAADRKIFEIRARLEALSGKTIGVDVDLGVAVAELEVLHRELSRIDGDDVSIDVKASTAAAAAELIAVKELADRIDGSDPNVKVRADGADTVRAALDTLATNAANSFGRIGALIALGSSIGPAIVPAAAAAASAIGAIGTAAAAAGAGLGVAILGFSGVGDAVKALYKSQNDAAKSSASLVGAQNRVAGALDSVRSAERSLENTRDQVASSARRAAQQVVDATRGVAQAQQDASRQVAEANRDAERAQEDLTKAQKRAQEQQEDLAIRLKGGALAQRQATLDITKAKKELDKLLANPTASKDELEQATVTYEKRKLQLEDLTVQQKRMSTEQEKNTKLGISGSDLVRDAQERVRQANEKVETTQTRTAETVRAAQQRLTESITSQQDQQRQGQFQIEQATAAVASAQRGVEQASVRAGTAGGAAMDNLREAMDNLSPAGQRFAKFLFGLRGKFLELRGAAQEGLLPGVQTAIESLLPYFPQLKKFVSDVAVGLGGLFVDAAEALKDPVWQKFFGYLASSAVPALKGMFTVFSNVARGAASLFTALSPLNKDIGAGLVKLTEDFAKWAASLQDSQGFQKFLSYLRESGPEIVDMIKSMGGAFINLVKAAAPIGLIVVKVLTAIADGIASIPTGLLSVLIGLVGGLAAGILVLVTAQRIGRLISDSWTVGQRAAAVASDRFGSAAKKAGDDSKAAGDKMKSLGTEAGKAGDNTKAASDKVTALGTAARKAGDDSKTAGDKVTALGTQARKAGDDSKDASDKVTAFGTQARKAGDDSKAAGDNMVAFGGLARKVGDDSKDAGEKVSGFSKVTEGVKGSMGKAKSGITDVMDVLGPPWLLILGGAIEAMQLYAEEQERARTNADNIVGALKDSAEAFRDTGEAAGKEALEGFVKSNKAFGTLLKNIEQYGVTLDTFSQALQGNRFASDKVIGAVEARAKAVNEEITSLKEANTWWGLLTGGNVDNGNRVDSLIKEKQALDNLSPKLREEFEFQRELNRLKEEAKTPLERYTDQLHKQADAYARGSGVVKPLIDLVKVYGDNSSTAADKANALKTAIDAATDAAKKQEDGLLLYEEQVDRSQKSIQDLKDDTNKLTEADKLHVTSLDRTTDSARDAQRALIDRAKAIRDGYIEDIAAGKPEEEARKRLDDRTRSLENEYKQAGFNMDRVKDLTGIYGKVPPSIPTTIELLKLDDVINNLGKFRENAIAARVAAGEITPDEGKRQVGEWNRAAAKGWATGGLIRGPGFSTSDDIPAMLSNREYVQPTRTVDYYGVDLMEAIRHRRIPNDVLRSILPGRAAGGPVFPIKIPIKATSLQGKMVSRLQSVLDSATSGLGFAGTRGGAEGIKSFIRGQDPKPYVFGAAGPNSWDCSGLTGAVYALMRGSYAPGRRYFTTFDFASGAPAGFKPGRGGTYTVGVNPQTHMAGEYGGLRFEAANSKAGIRVGAAAKPVGTFQKQFHMASGGLVLADPELKRIIRGYRDLTIGGDPSGMTLDGQRVFDRGGWLPPGQSLVMNGTGRPEPVLTDGQWRTMAGAAQAGAAAGNVYQFEFRDTTLTPDMLRSMQSRDAALARVSRAR